MWRFIGAGLSAGESVVFLLVVDSNGSSPGRPGFKMAVRENEMRGSIGGGVMEVALVERARDLLKPGASAQTMPIRQVHRKDSRDGSGMICSGEQSVLMRLLNPGDASDIEGVAEALANDRGVLEITPNSFGVVGSTESEGYERIGEENYSYREKLGRKDSLFIVGGGHCSLALSEIMSKLEFSITVFDDRPNLNTLAKNDFAHRVRIIEDYESIGDSIPSGKSNYVVVMTIGYKYDKVVVRELLNKEFGYFGVLGSKAKMAVLLKELREEGFNPEKLENIHTPIGLRISSRTPAEIAVSIAAEIIMEKNTGAMR